MVNQKKLSSSFGKWLNLPVSRMNWVTAIWSILIGCCVAMAVPQLVVEIWQRRMAQLFFVAMSVAVMGVALCELSLMDAESVADMKRMEGLKRSCGRVRHLDTAFVAES